MSTDFEKKDAKDRQRAEVSKAVDEVRRRKAWGMYIDPHKCTGCRACQVSCKAENNTPPGVSYMVIIESTDGLFPYGRRSYMPKPCQHCAQPACCLVCPVIATYLTPDGTVVMDYNKCIGCRYCMTACPYGSRYFDFGDRYGDGCAGEVPYEHERPTTEYGREWWRHHEQSPVGNVRKCHHCMHRLVEGSLPTCVTSCPTDALVFGDLNDPNSLVREMVSRNPTSRMKEELGNEPKTYYRA